MSPRLAAIAIALGTGVAHAQPHPVPTPEPTAAADSVAGRYQAFDAAGEALPLDQMLDEAVGYDVVFVGEIHNDPTAHAVEFAVLEGLARRAGARPVVLALEMFDTDVQTVLDEYITGLISERDFLDAARPWANYTADYRPLVEFARANGLRVVASNAPVRYVRSLARGGTLAGLSPEALGWLPPLPVAPPSDATADAFAAVMGRMASGGASPLLDAQNLRDASMAWRTAQALRDSGRPLVVHVNGSFHTAGRRGIPEHLARLAPDARAFLIAIEPAPDVDAAPDPAGSDAVVQTDARLLPSRSGG